MEAIGGESQGKEVTAKWCPTWPVPRKREKTNQGSRPADADPGAVFREKKGTGKTGRQEESATGKTSRKSTLATRG